MADTIWSDDFSRDNFGDGVSSRYTLPLQRRSGTDPFTHIDPFVLRDGLNYTGVTDDITPIWVDNHAGFPSKYASIEVGCTARLSAEGGHEILQYVLTFGWAWPSSLPGSLLDWRGTTSFALYTQMRVANRSGFSYIAGGISHQASSVGVPIRPDWVYSLNIDPLDMTVDRDGTAHIDLSTPRDFRVTMTANGLVIMESGISPIAGLPSDGGPPTTRALTVQTTPDYAQTIADMFDAGLIYPFCLLYTDTDNTLTLTDWHYGYAACGKDSGGGGPPAPNPIPSGMLDIPQLPLGGLVRRIVPQVMGGYPRLTPDVPSIQIPRS